MWKHSTSFLFAFMPKYDSPFVAASSKRLAENGAVLVKKHLLAQIRLTFPTHGVILLRGRSVLRFFPRSPHGIRVPV